MNRRICLRILSLAFATGLALSITLGVNAARQHSEARALWEEQSAQVEHSNYNRQASDQAYAEAARASRVVRFWAFAGGLALIGFMLVLPRKNMIAVDSEDTGTNLLNRYVPPLIDSFLGALLTIICASLVIGHSTIESPLIAAASSILPLLPFVPHVAIPSGKSIGIFIMRNRAGLPPKLSTSRAAAAVLLGPLRIALLWMFLLRQRFPRLFERLCLL